MTAGLVTLRVGDVAPDFTLPTDAGKPLALSSLLGRPVVLYFYPQDDTETCTAQACALRDAFPRFRRAKAVVLGVSPDSVASHARFRKKYRLPFPLLADPGHAVADLYGVWQEKTTFGRTYMGIARTTFVIDGEGVVARVFEKVRVKGHAEAVEDAVRELAGS